MFFDIAWPEFLLIGVIALVVIGPKDLPRAMRVAGFWLRKARSLSREFQSSIDQMIREAELEEVREELKKASELDLGKEIRNTVDPKGELAESLKPPELPDYFDEPPGPTTLATTEPAAALPAQSETAAATPLPISEGTPDATDPHTITPDPGIPALGITEPAVEESAPEHNPVPPKP